MGNRKFTDEQELQIANEYKNGKSCVVLRKEYNCSKQTILKILHERNVEMRSGIEDYRKYQLNENYFDVIDTEHKAYWLGWLYADGCNHANANHITMGLQESDKIILERFSNDLESNRPLIYVERNQENPTWQNVWRIHICSRHMSEQLTKLGCCPGKTFTAKLPTENQVPKHLIHHWVRGFWDGDGSNILHLIKSRKYRMQLSNTLTGTTEMCVALSKLFYEEIGITSKVSHHSKHTQGIDVIAITGNLQCIKFMEWIYTDATTYLERKYEVLSQAKLIRESREQYWVERKEIRKHRGRKKKPV